MGRSLNDRSISDQAVRLERVYRTLWARLHRRDEEDLRQHESQLLAHIPPGERVSLAWLATHLLLPKSSASVLVKSLEERGFVTRRRLPENQRQLAITLTPKGQRRVAASTVLDVEALADALAGLPPAEVESALRTLEALATALELTS